MRWILFLWLRVGRAPGTREHPRTTLGVCFESSATPISPGAQCSGSGTVGLLTCLGGEACRAALPGLRSTCCHAGWLTRHRDGWEHVTEQDWRGSSFSGIALLACYIRIPKGRIHKIPRG